MKVNIRPGETFLLFKGMITFLLDTIAEAAPDADWDFTRAEIEKELHPLLSDDGRMALFEFLNEAEATVLIGGEA